MKTAYKDLKTKLSDRTPPKGSSTARGNVSSMMPGTTASMYQHHSAPNSPVFTKRPQTELFSMNSNSSQHQRKPSSHTLLQTSNSMMNNTTANLTNHINNNNHNHNNNHNNNINSSNSYSNSSNSHSHINNTNNKTPTRTSPSPTSSNSSSEMNLLQELQQHALFKSPAVDRSVSVFGLAAIICSSRSSYLSHATYYTIIISMICLHLSICFLFC